VAGNTYSLDGGPYTTTLLYSGLAAGSTHTVTAKNALGCISTATVITINAQPSTPTAPLVIVIQPTCTTATGSIIITVVSGETYSLDGGPYTSTTNYNGLAAGSTHSVVAKNAIGCVSSLTTVSINNQPTTSNVILFCDVPQFPNSVAFDWNPVQGFTSYNYTYSIDNQPSVSGTTVMSNFQVLGVLQGQSVTFSLLINEGICSGVFTATCSTLANTDFENGDIQYFPNPVNDILNITSLKTTATIQIINAIGQQVYSERITTKDTQIEMSTLTKGIYIAKVTSENQIQTFKVIKK
jgi:hypothetical protein